MTISGPARRILAIGLLAAAAGVGCAPGDCDVVAYTSVDQVFADPVFREIGAETGLRVCAVFDTEESKSTGVLNRLLAEAGNPQADVFWSGDPIRPFVLIDRGLVEPYASPAAVGAEPWAQTVRFGSSAAAQMSAAAPASTTRQPMPERCILCRTTSSNGASACVGIAIILSGLIE